MNMKKAKLIGIIIISLLVLVVFLQNTQSAETKLLFVAVRMPIVILLMLTVLTGFIGGLVTKSYVLGKPGKAEAKDQR
ncbi:MAG: hypothetical protein RQ760_04750 [Sedimentisphaerales bacterium]|nr:hypothetical protein [Sedimentisphaerales bacterium]